MHRVFLQFSAAGGLLAMASMMLGGAGLEAALLRAVGTGLLLYVALQLARAGLRLALQSNRKPASRDLAGSDHQPGDRAAVDQNEERPRRAA